MSRIVFMGTPEFSVPTLRALAASGHEIVGVFTQPDRPAGRGNKLTACPAKAEALKLGLPVFQFEKLRAQAGLDCLRSLAPDVVVTAAFGQILSQKLLDVPKMGTVNVHASLLPQYRGSAPINWCIINGETKAGVTTMLTERGVDTGPMLLKCETEIGEMETAEQLSARLAEMGAQLLIETLDKYLSGEISPIPQDESASSYFPMLDRETGYINWTKPAREIACLVRGVNPWPCASTQMDGGRLKIYLAKAVETEHGAAPGTVLVSSAKQGLCIACGEGALEILEMQAPGGKRMAAKAYLAGKQIPVGTILN